VVHSNAAQFDRNQKPAFETTYGLGHDAVEEISGTLRQMLAAVFALYLKTKNFHWHMGGRSFRDYHLLLDEHADQIFAMTDDIAERARKIGASTLRSISDIARNQRLRDPNEEAVAPKDMLLELAADNRQLTKFLSGGSRSLPGAPRRGHNQLGSKPGSTRRRGARGSCLRSFATFKIFWGVSNREIAMDAVNI
jgi:starvation-inducible DNA-binding protein